MKVIFNYATRQFESMEPTMRERFALGGGVIQGEKVGGSGIVIIRYRFQ